MSTNTPSQKSTTTTTTPLKILIIGSGIVGLSTSISLRLKEHSVTIIDSSTQLSELGAGIQVPVNAMRVLDRWGLGLMDEVIRRGNESAGSFCRRYCDGVVKGLLVRGEREFGYKHVTIHRADYQHLLYEAALKAGATISFGKRVVDIEESEDMVSVTLDDGSATTCDLVVGADGIGSKVRSLMFKDTNINAKAIPTPECVYRIVLTRSQMSTSPILSPLLTNPYGNIWLGPFKHIVTYPIRGNDPELYNIVLCAPAGRSSDEELGVWNEAVSLDVVHKVFEEFEEMVQEFIRCADVCHRFRIAEVPVLPTWIDKGGRMVLIGDAAHAMMPHAGQGAAQGIEDAAVLGECLSNISSATQLRVALTAYEKLRKPRAERLQAVSRGNSRFWQLEDGPEQEARDARLRTTLGVMEKKMDAPGIDDKKAHVEPDANAAWMTPAFSSWLYQYDAIDDARRNLILKDSRI